MPNTPRSHPPEKNTFGERLMRVETQLNDHLVSCERSNANIIKVLFIGLTVILGVAAFGMTSLYANVNSQSQEIRRMLTSAQTQEMINRERAQ